MQGNQRERHGLVQSGRRDPRQMPLHGSPETHHREGRVKQSSAEREASAEESPVKGEPAATNAPWLTASRWNAPAPFSLVLYRHFEHFVCVTLHFVPSIFFLFVLFFCDLLGFFVVCALKLRFCHFAHGCTSARVSTVFFSAIRFANTRVAFWATSSKPLNTGSGRMLHIVKLVCPPPVLGASLLVPRVCETSCVPCFERSSKSPPFRACPTDVHHSSRSGPRVADEAMWRFVY